MKDLRDSHVPAWFWVGVPVVLYFGHYVLRAVTPFEFFDRYILHESGATEQGTVLVLVLALLTGLLVLRQISSLGDASAVVLWFVLSGLPVFRRRGSQLGAALDGLGCAGSVGRTQ
ncbi:hypothetical protein SSPSH_002122 [Salinisphaera shabanensis E1L3A]|uniref:Uncharacterized protein n=1 Tax=Salinisphaera shabanensis E1L3A TaxID=1033802 RepID=A0ACB4V5W3_9GAMM|nr:hypothetical protein [Salinisphaera shabanensis]ERJ19040.1 hypothetical protein SSPSH_002122 [Salinisphaera shabanensis E1L3A]